MEQSILFTPSSYEVVAGILLARRGDFLSDEMCLAGASLMTPIILRGLRLPARKIHPGLCPFFVRSAPRGAGKPAVAAVVISGGEGGGFCISDPRGQGRGRRGVTGGEERHLATLRLYSRRDRSQKLRLRAHPERA